jgi:hypothetical protein
MELQIQTVRTVRGPELSEKERREAHAVVIALLPGFVVVDYLPQGADESTESTTVYEFINSSQF